jgi:hypothetical protein
MDDGDELERRLADALGRAAAVVRARTEPAYARIHEGVERARRRHRRRTVAAGFATLGLIAAGGAALVAQLGGSDAVRTVTAPPADVSLPRLQAQNLPQGFEVASVTDVAAPTGPEPDEYFQVFRAETDRGNQGVEAVLRQTLDVEMLPTFGALTPAQTAIRIGTSPGVLTENGSDRLSVRWVDGQSTREIHAAGLTPEEVLVMARHVVPREDAPGLEATVLPGGLVLVDDDAIVEADDGARRELLYTSGDDATIDVTIRPGSPLELDYLRLADANAERFRRGSGTAVLLPGDDERSQTLYWAEGDSVIIEVSGSGVERGELLRFADDLRPVDQNAWEAFLAAASDRAVIVRGDEEAPSAAPDSDEPALVAHPYVLEGRLNGTLTWLASWDEPDADGRCLTVSLGAESADRCVPDGPSAFRVDLLGRTALVTVEVGPTATGTSVDGLLDDVTVTWLGAQNVPAEVVLEDGSILPVLAEAPDGADTTTPAPNPAEGVG